MSASPIPNNQAIRAMKVKEMIALLQKHDPEMRIGLLDLSTDNQTDMNYSLSEESFEVLDLVEEEDSPVIFGQGLFICFENNLN